MIVKETSEIKAVTRELLTLRGVMETASETQKKQMSKAIECLETCASKLSFIDRANPNLLCLFAGEKNIDEESTNPWVGALLIYLFLSRK